MKNLKKVLALGLALVMLLGMFTIASAAEDKLVASNFTDWDNVTNQDAVSLAVDLGIINGIPDGSFQPTGTIDRASWAKMVYYAANGTDAGASYYIGSANGLNDIAGSWAEGYISFLKSNNYVSGDGNGNFNPAGYVTTAEACKMMLTVLGYDADDKGYQYNANWAGNVMTDAKRNGLMEDVDEAMQAGVPLTRENAAQIIVNALNANMVEGEPQWDGGVKHIAKYNKLATLGYEAFKMVKVTATVSGIDDDGYATFDKVIEPTTGYTVANLKSIKGDASVVGATVNVYVKATGAKWDSQSGEMTVNGKFDGVISSAVAKATDEPVKVITGGITRWADTSTRGTSNFVAVADNWATTPAYYLNGNVATGTAVQTAAKNRGTVVEFYVDTNGKVSVVKAYNYDVKLVSNGDAQSRTLSDGTVQVKVPGVVNNWIDADKITGWQGLVEGDVVLMYATDLDSTKAYTLEKAEKVTGNVASYNSSGELTINSKKYKASEQNGVGGDVVVSENQFKSWVPTYNLTDEYDFFLDKAGAIAYVTLVAESLDQTKVCMVLNTEGNDATLGTTGNLKAQLLFVDGTTQIVNVSKVNRLTVVDTKQADIVANGEVAKKINTYEAEKVLGGTKGAALKTKFFNYKATSSGYELIELNSAGGTDRNWEDPKTTSAKVEILKQSDFSQKAAGLDGITADSTTTFIVAKSNKNDDTIAYSVYKGFKNVPEMDAGMVTAICANTSTNPANVNTVAKFVYIETGLFKDDVPEGYIMFVDNSWGIDPELEDVYVVNIVDTDGTVTTMRVDEGIKADLDADSMKMSVGDLSETKMVGKFFEVTAIDENGVVSAVELVRDVAKLNAMGNEVVTIGTDSYDYDSSTVFVYVDMGWSDSLTYTSGTVNVRDVGAEGDDYKLESAGTFAPNGFLNLDDISTDAKDGKTYVNVNACAIVPANSTTADYVYVVRVCW